MPNLRNDYTGVGKTVLDLFKKVFEVKKEYIEKKDSDLNQNMQKGGAEEAEGKKQKGKKK